MSARQLTLQLNQPDQVESHQTYRERLIAALSQDLDFHGQDSGYISHNFHSFPAKFPPQLPRKFIHALTQPGDVILDPMMGSGTTILESLLAGRLGIGFDIDPLAIKISGVKVTPLDVEEVIQTGERILERARFAVEERNHRLAEDLERRWNKATRKFVNYWFTSETQVELLALITEIEQIPEIQMRRFFELVFSATIITKSGGVSLALDLGHTRPHRAKAVVTPAGHQMLAGVSPDISPRRLDILTKTLRSPLEEFEKRLHKNLDGMLLSIPAEIRPQILFGNAQRLPLERDTVDLIITSPPYASNAIDYMRAHKFSLVWMHYPVEDLSEKRKDYIGGEVLSGIDFVKLPNRTARLVTELSKRDKNKGKVLHRYYTEMTHVLIEMYRVLKPGKAAIIVVGSSTMRGMDTETHSCLADIGQAVGFDVAKIGIRNLDRNRRMMPAGSHLDLDSQIQQRMHREYIIGFYKPDLHKDNDTEE